MKSGFYRTYDADFDARLSNQTHAGNRWRVNDETISFHPEHGERWETQANGLLQIEISENLRDLTAAELLMEVWGGHPHTRNKRFILNGKGEYSLPEVGTANGHCTYSYPCVPVELHHLVKGMNAFQFSCERGESFWGHFIIDTARLCCYLEEKCALDTLGLLSFQPEIAVSRLGDSSTIKLSLNSASEHHSAIQRVDYFGRYSDFDDRGMNSEYSWHGYTQKHQWHNRIGSSVDAPFSVNWDTQMLPEQTHALAFSAELTLHNGLKYRTPVREGIQFGDRPYSVQLIHCSNLPAPFWSRAGQKREATFQLDLDTQQIEQAWLGVRIWDGGEGDVDHPFLLNNYPYTITSGQAIHDLVFTEIAVDPRHLRTGENKFTLCSDTEHHGIEILLPGPCIKIKVPRAATQKTEHSE